ncbi:helix-turn-helix domain-containing protein [Thermomonospora amylolytica]|uniref:helix-turn-helix domain-containing protein n=1 Tax=Thermomonospora amylolytica TaxID=1411117 RepID=UPI0018E59F47|nr:helix-turn-helix domain-containing protein [Thermomonospora amylolytica]
MSNHEHQHVAADGLATDHAGRIRRRLLTDAEFDALPVVVGVETAATALGISRTPAYRLAKEGGCPCRVIRIAGTYLIAKADLARCLGRGSTVSPGDPAGSRS